MTTINNEIKKSLAFTDICSSYLEDTILTVGEIPRLFYLKRTNECAPPLIVHNSFVPNVFVDHLMCNKKNSALGVKFEENKHPPDAITNMEAALHTYVIPILSIKIHGDYRFQGLHDVLRYTSVSGHQRARSVVLSAAIQPDFEDQDVMLTLMKLEKEEVVGTRLPSDFVILDTASKQVRSMREEYDKRIRAHLIACLTQESRLPPLQEAESLVINVEEACERMESVIAASDLNESLDSIQRTFVKLFRGDVISLEMLCRSAEHQIGIEMAALEQLCSQGFIYTSDPPSIFAREIGAKLLNRCQIMGLKLSIHKERIGNMRIFAFNDYADKGVLELVEKQVFQSTNVKVLPKSEIFSGPGGAFKEQHGAENAVLVIHNNSDGFGQNIESESARSSLDGAIGFNSSAAASLLRHREDLTANRLII